MFPAAAAFADDGGDGVYAAGGGWLYHFASAERVYVADAVLAAANREEIEHGVPRQEERPEIRYDFASSNVDRESSSLIYGGAMSRAPAPG